MEAPISEATKWYNAAIEDAVRAVTAMGGVHIGRNAATRVANILSELIQPALGKTGEFPEGKLGEHDQGEIRMAVGVKDDNIILDFGTTVVWVAMKASDAVRFVSTVLQQIWKLNDPTGETWIIGEPGGPAGPFHSIVSSSGRVVALQIPDKETAEYLVNLHDTYRSKNG